MTVNKLTYPSKENAVQEKINEIIDNLGGGGGSYTAGTGIDITNDVISVAAPTLVNKATQTDSVAILTNSTNSAHNTVAIGYAAYCPSYSGVAVGTNTWGGYMATAVGGSAKATNEGAVAIGIEAEASSNYSIQLGKGTNSEANSLYIGVAQAYNYKLLGIDGLIPDARISSNIARTSDIPAAVTESTVSGWGFTKNVGTVTSVNNTQPDANGNVTISTGGSYTAGTGIDITNDVISVDGEQASLVSLATVATSGSYNDLSNKPTIPTVDQTYSSSSTNAQSGTAVAQALSSVSVSKDNLSITNNSNNQLQTVGVIDQNDTTQAIKTWTGTLAQYNAIVTKDTDTLYNITDDTAGGSSVYTKSEVNALLTGKPTFTPLIDYDSLPRGTYGGTAVGSYTLKDNVSNYDYLMVTTFNGNALSSMQTVIAKVVTFSIPACSTMGLSRGNSDSEFYIHSSQYNIIGNTLYVNTNGRMGIGSIYEGNIGQTKYIDIQGIKF